MSGRTFRVQRAERSRPQGGTWHGIGNPVGHALPELKRAAGSGPENPSAVQRKAGSA